jgi:Flp pilus assembly protein TadD
VNAGRPARPAPQAAVPLLALVALALLATATGLHNGFTFDDGPIILANWRVHELHHIARVFAESYWPPELGGRLYRPLTMVAFTLEWWAGGGSPVAFHVVNVVLYAAVTVALYALARQFLPAWAAWVAAALFAVHPVHVEVVANGVGQAELLAALTVVLATWWYVARRAVGSLRGRDVVGLALLYVAGCLSKEHAIVLPALLLAAEMTVVAAPHRRRELWPLAVTLGAVAIAYLAVRASVLQGVVGEIPAVEFRGASMATRWWTMLAIAGQWLRLLVWPVHLAAVYSPPATPVLHGPTLAVVPALVAIPAFVWLARRGPAIAFGLAWAGICLLPTSNVLVPTGVYLAERTLFLPSVGVVMAIAAAVATVEIRVMTVRVAMALVLVAALMRSAMRQRVWHDDAALFASAVADEPRSYAAHYQWARALLAAGQHDTGVREAERAVQLYPDDPELAGVLGRAYAVEGRCASAVPLLRQTVTQLPSRIYPRARLVRCLVQLGDTISAVRIARDGVTAPADTAARRHLLAFANQLR